jgi:tRNA(fMet)-specific endonuclease VapC
VSPRYLLDTNVLSERLRLQPHPTVIQRLNASEGLVATAAPVVHELLFGALRLPPSSGRALIEHFLSEAVLTTMSILPYDTAAAEWHARERARLVTTGRTPPFLDGQIAAIAHTNGLILVTANVADYRNFADLQIEDWRT